MNRNKWVTRNNGLHTIILDSDSDLAYIGEFKDEKIARRIADDHNNRLSADAEETHQAMMWIGYWLCLGRYRTVMRRHNGCYRATDQAVNPPQEWNADKLCQLVGLMRGELEGTEI